MKLLTGTLFFAVLAVSVPVIAANPPQTSDDVSTDTYLKCLKDKETAQQNAAKYKNHLFCLKMNCPKTDDLKECAAKYCGFEL